MANRIPTSCRQRRIADLRLWGLMLVLLLAIAAPTSQLSAQDQAPTDTIYYNIYNFYESAADANWRACALLTHPDELARFKRAVIAFLDWILPTDGIQDCFARQFFLLPTFTTVRRVEPFMFYVRMMAVTASLRPDWFGSIRTMDIAVGDYVEEGDSIRHYLVWQVYPVVNASIEELRVFTMRRSDGTWYCMLSGEWDPGRPRYFEEYTERPKNSTRID